MPGWYRYLQLPGILSVLFFKNFVNILGQFVKNSKIGHKLGEQFFITIGGISLFVTTVKTKNSRCTKNSCVPGVRIAQRLQITAIRFFFYDETVNELFL